VLKTLFRTVFDDTPRVLTFWIVHPGGIAGYSLPSN